MLIYVIFVLLIKVWNCGILKCRIFKTKEKIKKEERGELMDKYISNKIKNISLIMTFFVVILHSNNLEDPSVLNINTLIQNFIGQGIVRIAVPMFFLISFSSPPVLND